jgi:hypothetical protein
MQLHITHEYAALIAEQAAVRSTADGPAIRSVYGSRQQQHCTAETAVYTASHEDCNSQS